MSWNAEKNVDNIFGIATVCVLASAWSAAAADLMCPLSHQGRELVGFSLYQGPSANLAEIIGWNHALDLPPPLPGVLPYFVGCKYRGMAGALDFELPAAFRKCTGVTLRHVGNLVTQSNVRCE